MLASSFTGAPDTPFEGYCFVGDDYVAESTGYRQFVHRGGTVSPGLDGCYTIARPTESGFEIGTDARGLRRLFLYRDGDTWAVSSSLYQLVDHLRAHDVGLKPCLPVLRAMGAPKGLSAQLNSTQTIFENVTLIPSFCQVLIDHDTPVLRVSDLPESRKSYEEALSDFIATWLSRFNTLASHPQSQFTMDLSGGLDSRVVIAFALRSGALHAQPEKFRISSQPNSRNDFAAAQAIAAQHQLELNTGKLPTRVNSGTDLALQKWQDTSLGVYLPIYLSPFAFDPLYIRGHGAGGGTFRDIFTHTSLKERIHSLRPHLDSSTFDAYADIVLGDFADISSMRPHVDAQKLHYREFRNRLHFGHAPHNRPAYTPVNSILTDELADRPDFDTMNLYYDTLDSLVPGLKNEAYDDPSKLPTDVEPSAASRVVGRPSPRIGSVYSSDHLPSVASVSPRAAFEQLYTDAARALRDETVQDAIGNRDVHRRCQEALKRVRESSSRARANHQDHKDISYLLAAAFAVGI